MNKEEMICKNCKYHYIEEISFDYPQSCCSKREATTEEWCKCNGFEYSNRYIEQLQQENQELKKQLKEQIKEYQKAVDKTMSEKIDIENNWNKLKKYIKTEIPEDVFIDTEWFVSILDKMQELEKGSDE